MKQSTQPRLPLLDARDLVMLLDVCEWLIDQIHCVLDEIVRVKHDMDDCDQSAADASVLDDAPGPPDSDDPF